jgi:predicted O-methyltransferase YrrM
MVAMSERVAPVQDQESQYLFTVDWFDAHAAIWRELLTKSPPKRVLEIGSYEGRSACFLFDECASLQELTCVDTWEGGAMPDVERRFDWNISCAQSRRVNPVRLRKIKARSSEALPALIVSKEQFDWVYVDGSHKAPDVLTDAVNAFYLLRVGGVLIFDDYLWSAGPNENLLELPKPAIDAFSNIFHQKLAIWRSVPLYQLYLKKTGE